MTQIKTFYSRNASPSRELESLESRVNGWLTAHDADSLVVDMKLHRDSDGTTILLLYEQQMPYSNSEG